MSTTTTSIRWSSTGRPSTSLLSTADAANYVNAHNTFLIRSGNPKGNKGRSVPRIVCCAIPISRAAGKVLVITSRKRPTYWVLPKGGYETTDMHLEAAASREALEEAGVRGTITRYVITIPTPAATYHFYELDVVALDPDWQEGRERRREWVDYSEAVRRLEWKAELAHGLKLSSLAR